jgi:Uma2 family endonuclease
MAIDQKTPSRKRRQHPHGGTPTWQVAYLFPAQGDWTEEDYLNLENQCGSHIRVELFHGRLEILPVPTQTHQFIIWFLLKALELFVSANAPGIVLFSGIRVKIPSKRKKPQFREPDIVYMKAENAHRRHDVFWEGADLAMEVVSGTPSDRKRDLITKRREYAAAGIREYWIIDPDEGSILVLTLQGKTYQVHGEFRRGTRADSVLLPGFTVSVDEVLDAGNK